MMADGQHAQLVWDEQGLPQSARFGDVYFSSDDGLAETHHTFLTPNQLTERFSQLKDGERFVIGETGFGTGLSFLAAWQLFARCANATASLHFISVERYPLTHADLTRALALWPELSTFSAQLLRAYVAVEPGFQRLVLAEGRVVLTLLIGDVCEMLPSLEAEVDAWFLDGFSPAKNPEMWRPELFGELARLSASGATLATFTSASDVRRGLIGAGFAVTRREGFGKKREMLAGPFTGAAKAAVPAWFSRPPAPRTRRAVVLGAGLAGACAAYSLAIRGWQVTVIDRQPSIAAETSGNRQGILYLKLSSYFTSLTRFVLSGFGYTRRLLEQLDPAFWQACGVLQMPVNAQDEQRHAQLAEVFDPGLLHPLSATEASALSGVELSRGGLFFPSAGWVHPPALCQMLLEHPNIELKLGVEISSIARHEADWQLFQGEQLIAQTEQLVLANAQEVNRLLALNLSVKPIRGQITELAATQESTALNTVLCEHGYVAPAIDQVHTLGASFRFKSTDLSLNEAEQQENLDLLSAISTDLFARLNAAQAPLQGRAGFRCTSPDYLPVVGPVSDPQAFVQAYGILRKDSRHRPATPCPWLPGLYVSTAHGSRGLISAPLCGEILAAWMNAEPLPVEQEIAEACHPNRFALKALIRRQV